MVEEGRVPYPGWRGCNRSSIRVIYVRVREIVKSIN